MSNQPGFPNPQTPVPPPSGNPPVPNPGAPNPPQPAALSSPRRMRTVLLYCLWVDTDGMTPVNKNGNPTYGRGKCYSWEPKRRSEKWLAENPNMWKPLPARKKAA